MSGNINLAVRNQKSESGSDIAEISFTITLSDEKSFRIKEILKDADNTNKEKIVESIIKLVTEDEKNSCEDMSFDDYEEAATMVLRDFGIPAHTKGYRYLREAVVLVAQKPMLVEGITKCLYPSIASHNSTTAERVERVIRHAIESGCTKGDTQALYHYFPHSISKDKEKPTNAEFIAVLGDIVKRRVSKRQMFFAGV